MRKKKKKKSSIGINWNSVNESYLIRNIYPPITKAQDIIEGQDDSKEVVERS
jgi:hypothetical protein